MKARSYVRYYSTSHSLLRTPLRGLGRSAFAAFPRQTIPLCRVRLPSGIRAHVSVRHLATGRFQELPADIPIEEELVPGYSPDDYYPVRLGEVFDNKYRVVAKLGRGVGSTAWLCRDLRQGYSLNSYCPSSSVLTNTSQGRSVLDSQSVHCQKAEHCAEPSGYRGRRL